MNYKVLLPLNIGTVTMIDTNLYLAVPENTKLPSDVVKLQKDGLLRTSYEVPDDWIIVVVNGELSKFVKHIEEES